MVSPGLHGAHAVVARVVFDLGETEVFEHRRYVVSTVRERFVTSKSGGNVSTKKSR